MRTYSIFTPQRWIGATGRQLRRGIRDRQPGDPERESYKDAQIVADVLLNNPNANHYGLYYITTTTLSDLSGLRAEEITVALTILDQLDYASYDDTSEFVWVKEMARVQMFLPLKAGDRQVQAANSWYRQVPRNPYLGRFYDRYVDDLRLETRREEHTQTSADRRVHVEPMTTSLWQQWFLIFLEAYPASRRVGGAAGEAAFARAMRGRGQEHLNVMLDAVYFQRQSEQWLKGVVPGMLKWLDEEHWTRDLAGGRHAGGGSRFECPDNHPECSSPGHHALRVALGVQCNHEPKCQSFLEHYHVEETV